MYDELVGACESLSDLNSRMHGSKKDSYVPTRTHIRGLRDFHQDEAEHDAIAYLEFCCNACVDKIMEAMIVERVRRQKCQGEPLQCLYPAGRKQLEALVKTPLPLGAWVLGETSKQSVVLKKLRELGLECSIESFLSIFRIHNVEYSDDPPLEQLMRISKLIRSIVGSSGATTLYIIIALGRSTSFMQWVEEQLENKKSELSAWVQTAKCTHASLDALRYIVVNKKSSFELGDGKTNETTRIKKNPHVNWNRLTTPVYDLIDAHKEDSIINAENVKVLFDILVTIPDLKEFRANHVSLWLSAAFQIPLGLKTEELESILGPNPKRFRQMMANRNQTLQDHYENVRQGLAQSSEEINWLNLGDFNCYQYQFCLCKFVQLIDFLCYLRKPPSLHFRIDAAFLPGRHPV